MIRYSLFSTPEPFGALRAPKALSPLVDLVDDIGHGVIYAVLLQ
jgi:hypothetical protein